MAIRHGRRTPSDESAGTDAEESDDNVGPNAGELSRSGRQCRYRDTVCYAAAAASHETAVAPTAGSLDPEADLKLEKCLRAFTRRVVGGEL